MGYNDDNIEYAIGVLLFLKETNETLDAIQKEALSFAIKLMMNRYNELPH